MSHTIKVNLSQAQLKAIHRAAINGTGVSLRLNRNQMVGDITLPVTKAQYTRYNQALGAGKGVELHLSMTAVRKLKTGGFLQAILPFLGPIASVAAPLISSVIGAFGKKGSGSDGSGLVNHGRAIPQDLMVFEDTGKGLRNFGEVSGRGKKKQ